MDYAALSKDELIEHLQQLDQPPVRSEPFIQAFHALPLLTIFFDINGTISFASKQAGTHPYTVFRHLRSGSSVFDEDHFETLGIRSLIRALCEEKKNFDVENPLKRKEADVLYFRCIGKSLSADLNVLFLCDVTERASMAHERENTIANYKTLFEMSPSGIILMDENGVVVEANSAMCQLLGYDYTELIGMHIRDFADASQKAVYKENIKRILSGETLKHTIIDKTKDGQIKHVHLHEKRYRLANNRYGILSIAQDISAIINAEKTLKEERDIIQTVLDTVPGEVSWINKDLVYLGANKFLARKHNIKKEDFVGRRVGFQQGNDTFYNFVKEFMEGEEERVEREITTYVENKNRSYIIIAQKYAGGESAVFIGIDITDRKEAEKYLKKQQQFSSNLIETAPAMILRLIEPDIIVDFNEYAESITGYHRSEVIGKSFIDLFVPDHQRPLIAHMLEEIFSGRSKYHGEPTPVLTKTKETRLISWQNALVRDPIRKQIALLSIGLDITDKVKMEEELRQALKMEAIGRLAGGVAHDFNNLLTVIQGYTELSRLKTEPDSGIYESLTEIEKAVHRASRMTSQLLAFGRKQVLDPVVFDLCVHIRDIRKILKHLITEDISLNIDIPESPLPVLMDPNQLESVLINLVINARDAMPQGGVIALAAREIHLQKPVDVYEGVLESGHYVLLHIRDTGVGIAMENLKQIFEPFYTTKEVGKGTGLGLSMIYGIIKQSGGEIKVSSLPGAGTTFSIYLPYSDSPLQEPHSHTNGKPELPKFAGRTFLVVEDNKALREMIAGFLKKREARVFTAQNGLQGYEIFKKHNDKIDMILSDVMMPRMNGKELADKVREINPALKILFMSGHSQEVIESKTRLPQNMDIIEKPFDLFSLAHKLNDFYHRSPRSKNGLF